MTESKPKIGGLLLAAGGSRRMGSPKQLLEFEGMTLIRRAAEALIDAECDPVVVVLGAEVEMSREELIGLDLVVVENTDWAKGMSSSIRVGLQNLIEINSKLDAVMITLCDQPHITAENLKPFLTAFRTDRSPVIAAEYGEVVGVPALFSTAMFDRLMHLKGDRGARELIRSAPDAVTIPLPEAAIDIDSLTDLGRLGRGSD